MHHGTKHNSHKDWPIRVTIQPAETKTTVCAQSPYMTYMVMDTLGPNKKICVLCTFISSAEGLKLLALVLQSGSSLGRECPKQQLGANLHQHPVVRALL